MVRLGQNFLADPNLLDAIVRDAALRPEDVVLEVGAGEGVLTERLAAAVEPTPARGSSTPDNRGREQRGGGFVHAVELDRDLEKALAPIAARPNVALHWGDAMRIDLAALDPTPTAVVANLPYSIATPLLLRTVEELPGVTRWTVMVQREIADRLRAEPGTRAYGAPSVLVQLACEVRLLRPVDPAVFKPRPRVESAILALRRTGPGADAHTRDLVRAAFAHRRKTLARSLEHAGASAGAVGGRAARPGSEQGVMPESPEATRAALRRLGLPEDARAEQLSPSEFQALTKGLSR
jgi:16S rRNA (adenine1518-N6/adenine1519-N6)-dimethyltransferase